MRRASAVAMAMALIGVVGACNWSLGWSQAREILGKDEIGDGGIRCVWTAPRLSAKGVWTYVAFDEPEASCVDQLQEAGLLVAGQCTQEGCPRGCCTREIRGTETARLDEGAGGLVFRCGTRSVAEISGVTTLGEQATVDFVRQDDLDEPLLKSLAACVIALPPAGRTTHERSLQRDRSGTWSCLDCRLPSP